MRKYWGLSTRCNILPSPTMDLWSDEAQETLCTDQEKKRLEGVALSDTRCGWKGWDGSWPFIRTWKFIELKHRKMRSLEVKGKSIFSIMAFRKSLSTLSYALLISSLTPLIAKLFITVVELVESFKSKKNIYKINLLGEMLLVLQEAWISTVI